MIFNTGKIFGRVWKVTPGESGKYLDLEMTTSEKDKDGNYENSGWFPRVIGHALNTLKDVKKGDKIVITKSKFTNIRQKDEQGNTRSYFKFLVLEAEIDGGSSPQDSSAPQQEVTNNSEQGGDDSCPW